ncbi:hypothetical protein M9H77_08849 [Catharanthus roseus]|uniref:Uncharacterized protein n=1 Tax=Catharanthus roseus TaxID=4058 RepID=A0ACC0BYY4_CATRO|nr:hypothetical protein M9H77_08849 [Catharanthus roseus]
MGAGLGWSSNDKSKDMVETVNMTIFKGIRFSSGLGADLGLYLVRIFPKTCLRFCFLAIMFSQKAQLSCGFPSSLVAYVCYLPYDLIDLLIFEICTVSFNIDFNKCLNVVTCRFLHMEFRSSGVVDRFRLGYSKFMQGLESLFWNLNSSGCCMALPILNMLLL